MNNKLKNFSFEHEGKQFWWSRSMATCAYIFSIDSMNDLYILITKRGNGAATDKGKWCVPCGYLDCNEGIAECSAREVFEETGLKVNSKELRLFRIDDKPHGEYQNVTFSFVHMLPGFVGDYAHQLSKDNMEDNEVDEIKFVKVRDIDKYAFAFGHDEVIKKLLNRSLYPEGVEFTSFS